MRSGQLLMRVRLSVMMFIQFGLWAAWYMSISGYMEKTLEFTGGQISWVMATTALGAMISPLFVGFIADRYFSTEKVLAVLHLAGGLCLLLASTQTSFPLLFALLLLNGLCFMPTLALVNSVAFRNLDDPDKFSYIAVWGTIGWIVAVILVGQVLGGATEKNFFFLAGGGAIAMALYSLSLPHTPPKGAEAGGDVLGLGALRLLGRPSFLVFALCAFMISVPLSFYFVWMTPFLLDTQNLAPATTLTSISQFSEIFIMFLLPWFIPRIGLKKVLVIGMAAWAARYLLFSLSFFPLTILGLLLHGFCYVFVFVAAFIYVNKVAPRELSASAQSFLAFLMWGVGMFIGTKLAGYVGDMYKTVDGRQWGPIWLWPAMLAAIVCVLFLLGGRDLKSEDEEPEGAPPEEKDGLPTEPIDDQTQHDSAGQ